MRWRRRSSRHRRRGGAADRSPGQAGQARRDPLVPTDRIAGFTGDSGGQLLVRDNGNHFGDRQQHEPLLSDRRSSHRLGGAVSRTERERGQTAPSTQPPAQGCALVEDHARSMRLGRQAGRKTALLQGAILSTSQARRGPQESHLRRRRLDSDRHLSHPQGRRSPPRPSASTTSTSASPRPRSSGSSLKSPSSASKRPCIRSRKRRDAVPKGKRGR